MQVSKNFQTIKKKYQIAAIIAAVVLGICCGIGATCVLAVVLKRCAVELFWAIYIPVALALSAGFFGLWHLALRPTDKKLAKKLDKDYVLGQKVQTMVEYEGAAGAMPYLQREQANEVLGTVAKKRVDIKWLLKFLFIPVLAVAMLFVGIFVPARKSSNDPTYNITDGQKAALESLIKDVQDSDMTEELIENTVGLLEVLLQGLRESQPQSVMRRSVVTAVKTIDQMIADENSYIDIYNAIKDETTLSTLAASVGGGVVFFTSGGTRITNFNGVKTRQLEADGKISESLTNWSANFLSGYTKKAEGESESTPKPIAEAVAALKTYTDNLNRNLLKLTAYAEAEKKDGLYAAFETMVSSFKTLAATDPANTGLNDKGFYDTLAGYCGTFNSAALRSMITQSYNCMMDEFIRNSLARTFNVTLENSVAILRITGSSGNDNNDNNKPNDGSGPGDDDPYYPDGEKILDIDTGLPEHYSKYLNKYKGIVDDYIKAGQENGTLSDELIRYIQQYFNLLSNK